MKQPKHHNKPLPTRQMLIALALVVISQSAMATPGQSQLSTLQTWLTVAGGVIVTLALMFAAFKMMVQKTPWHEISHVFWGGILFGCAPIIGAMLITG